jgi:hypothetical protein
MEAHARRVTQASTRARQEMMLAASVRHTRARLRRAQLGRNANAMPTTLDPMEAHIRHVSQEIGNARQELAAAKTAQQPLHLLILAY